MRAESFTPSASQYPRETGEKSWTLIDCTDNEIDFFSATGVCAGVDRLGTISIFASIKSFIFKTLKLSRSLMTGIFTHARDNKRQNN